MAGGELAASFSGLAHLDLGIQVPPHGSAVRQRSLPTRGRGRLAKEEEVLRAVVLQEGHLSSNQSRAGKGKGMRAKEERTDREQARKEQRQNDREDQRAARRDNNEESGRAEEKEKKKTAEERKREDS